VQGRKNVLSAEGTILPAAYRFAFLIPNWSWAMMNLQMFADPSTIA
jgi:hypothetical protein